MLRICLLAPVLSSAVSVRGVAAASVGKAKVTISSVVQ